MTTSRTTLNSVMQLNQTALEALDGLQIERHMLVATRDQRNAIADEDRYYADHKLVDRPLVEKGGDEIAAAHQPDVLARRLAKLAHIRADWIPDELHASWHISGRFTTREDDRLTGGVELRAQAQAYLVGLSPHQHRVDRLHESVHPVETLGSRPGCQPVEIAVRSGDVTVGAGRDVDDDVATFLHVTSRRFPSWRANSPRARATR